MEEGDHNTRLKLVLAQIFDGLFEWQLRWIRDKSKWRVALKARQLGYTTINELDALLQAAEHPGLDVYLVSTTVGNAAKVLRRVKERWLKALQVSGHPAFRVVKDTTTELELANGSKIYAIANEPDRMRGNPGSYYLDELGFWEKRKLELIQDALWPTIENPLNPHLRFVGVSTPWFADGLYYELCTSKMYRYFSRHEITIYDAIRLGLPFDAEGVKARITSDRWAREYLCQFLRGGSTYFSRDALLLLEAQHKIKRDRCRTILGVDLGKINDFTAIVVYQITPWREHVPVVYLMRSVDYGEQAQIIAQLAAKHHAELAVIDITKHASFVDQAPEELKRIALGKNFTNEWKAEWVPKIKKASEDKAFSVNWGEVYEWDEQSRSFVKAITSVLLDDFTRVVQGQTPSGKVKFDVPRVKMRGAEQDGHGDSFSGFLLGYWGAHIDDGQEAIAEQLDLSGPDGLDALPELFDIPDVW